MHVRAHNSVHRIIRHQTVMCMLLSQDNLKGLSSPPSSCIHQADIFLTYLLAIRRKLLLIFETGKLINFNLGLNYITLEIVP